MRLWHSSYMKERWCFPTISKSSYCCLGIKTQTDTAAGPELISSGPHASPASVPAMLSPFFPSRVMQRLQCVWQTPVFPPFASWRTEFRYIVPKVRRLSWGAALQFHSVYTVSQECYLHESRKPQHLLLFDSTQLKALPHETIKG